MALQLLRTMNFSSSSLVPHSTASFVLDNSPKYSEDPHEPPTSQSNSFEHHGGHPSATWPSHSAPPLTTTITNPTTTVTYVSSIPTPTLLTRLPVASVVPVSTTSSAANDLSTSTCTTPVILGIVLGVATIATLGVIVLYIRVRRRSKSQLASDTQASSGRRESDVTRAIPRIDPVMLGRRIISPCRLGVASARPSEDATTCFPKTGEFSSSSGRHLSDPFADSHQEMGSSRMSILSADSLSITMTFMSSEMHEGGEMEKSVDTSTSSLELEFVSPLVVREDSPTRSPYLSPTGHYDGLSPTSSPTRETRFWGEEEQGETITPSSPSRPFYLGAESARMRLHELLREARELGQETRS